MCSQNFSAISLLSLVTTQDQSTEELRCGPMDLMMKNVISDDEFGLRKTRNSLSVSQHECRGIKDDFRRNCFSTSHYGDQSSHKGASFFLLRKSSVSQKISHTTDLEPAEGTFQNEANTILPMGHFKGNPNMLAAP